ncbi:MAG: GldG family protein [Clostridia bacterium]|nr:GldG family protein [Clostridia bacterium]
MKKILTEEQAAVRGGAVKRVKAGTYTVVISLVILALLIVVNLLVSALPSKFTTYDTSVNKMYSISEASEKAARKVREDVTIYVICDPSQGEDTQMNTFLTRYADLSSHITVKVIDPVSQPTFTQKYTANTLTNYSVIVESAKRFRVIDYAEMAFYTGGLSASADYKTLVQYFELYYATYNEYPSLYFVGESMITSALDYVTQDDMTVIYSLSGHGEAEISATLSKQLSYSNVSVAGAFASLTATALPEDCDILLINAPRTDINATEAAMIRTFLQNGGNVMMATEPGISAMPNLLSVAEACGLSAADGVIIEQTAKNYSNYPYWPLPVLEEHEALADLTSGYYMIMPLAHGIVRAESVPAGVTIAPIFSTSSAAYLASLDTGSLAKPEGASERSYWLGASAVTAGGGKLIWLSSATAITDDAQRITGANYSFVNELANWLCPRQTILEDIAPISMDEPVLVVTAGAALIGSAILILAVPAAFIITGLVIWIRRRRR